MPVLDKIRSVRRFGITIIEQLGLLLGQVNPLVKKLPNDRSVLDHPEPPTNLAGKGVGMSQRDTMMCKHVSLRPLLFDVVDHLKTQNFMRGLPQGLKVLVQALPSSWPKMEPGVAIDQDLKVWRTLQFTKDDEGLPAPEPKPAGLGREASVMALAVIRWDIAFGVH